MFGNLSYDLFPKMVRVRQRFESPKVENLRDKMERELSKTEIEGLVGEGMRIAILVGSRGIKRIDEIVHEVIKFCVEKKAIPFIVPAMASHGGATDEGQKDLLRSLGIDEQSMGVRIISDMLPERLGETIGGVPVYFDKNALAADGVIVINRVKAHTAFRGEHESGLVKMLTIGAGKQKGAESLHSQGADTFGILLPEAFKVIKAKADILFGVAVIENAEEKTAHIETVHADRILERETELLKLSKKLMPKILLDHFDVLIVDELGKNISGDGMDPNITGRYAVPGISGGPNYQRLVLLDVTDQSHGNAIGIGMADVTTRKLVSKINYEFMYLNAFTSKMVLDLVKIPLVCETEKEAVAVALRTCVRVKKGQERIVRIKNTLELSEIQISVNLLKEIENSNNFDILTEPFEMEFNDTVKV